MKMFPETRCKD